MDLTNLLWVGGLIALFFFMMRGCGGMGGGCGTGSRRRDPQDGATDAQHDQKRVA